MTGKLAIHRGVLALATLVLLFAPVAAYAEKVIDDDEADHSNQDWGEPDARKAPRPITPAHWGGPKAGPGSGEVSGDLGLPSGDGADSWIADVLTGTPQQFQPFVVLVVPGDGALGDSPVRHSLGLDGFGRRPLDGGISGGTFGSPPPVPEPATPVLLLLGAALLAARRRK